MGVMLMQYAEIQRKATLVHVYLVMTVTVRMATLEMAPSAIVNKYSSSLHDSH